MLTTPTKSTFPDAAKKAEEHLRGFFQECTDRGAQISFHPDDPKAAFKTWTVKWEKLYSEINKVIKQEEQSLAAKEQRQWDEEQTRKLLLQIPTGTEPLQYHEGLFKWLEDRKHSRKWPWRRGIEKVELKKDEPVPKEISHLLNLFKRSFLDELCMPDRPGEQWEDMIEDTDKLLQSATDDILPDNWLPKKFFEFVGKGELDDDREWKVEVTGVHDDDPEMAASLTWFPVIKANFVSWLVVYDEKKTLYILYSKLAIKTGPRYKSVADSADKASIKPDGKGKTVPRCEKLLLHELGHAVTHLQWYRDVLRNKRSEWIMAHDKKKPVSLPSNLEWIGSPPSHEFDAWAYTFAVRGCVKSARSWITRLIDEADNDWFNP